LNEGYVQVVDIEKNNADFNMLATRMEINQNLALVLAPKFFNPYMGWLKVAKVLSMYGIVLPRVIFKDLLDGEEVVVLQQFGEKSGADISKPTDRVDGHITPPNAEVGDPREYHQEYYLVFKYELDWEDGSFYTMTARVVDEDEMDEMLEDDEDMVEPEGELDPRQP